MAGDVVLTSADGYALSPSVSIDPFADTSGEPFADLADTIDVTIARVRIRTQLEANENSNREDLVRNSSDDALPPYVPPR